MGLPHQQLDILNLLQRQRRISDISQLLREAERSVRYGKLNTALALIESARTRIEKERLQG